MKKLMMFLALFAFAAVTLPGCSGGGEATIVEDGGDEDANITQSQQQQYEDYMNDQKNASSKSGVPKN